MSSASDIKMLMFFRCTRPEVRDGREALGMRKQWEYMLGVFLDESSLSAEDKESFKYLCTQAPREPS